MVQRLTRQWNWTHFWMTNRFSTERCRASSQISSCPTSIQSRKSILCDTYLPCRVIYLYSSLFIKHCCINKFVFKILQLSSDELCYMHYSVEFTFFPRCLHYWAFKNTYADFRMNYPCTKLHVMLVFTNTWIPWILSHHWYNWCFPMSA